LAFVQAYKGKVNYILCKLEGRWTSISVNGLTVFKSFRQTAAFIGNRILDNTMLCLFPKSMH